MICARVKSRQALPVLEIYPYFILEQMKKLIAYAALAELIEKYQNVAAVQIAEIYAYRSDRDKAFEWLDRAYNQRDMGLCWMKGDPMLRGLEHDSRYTAFLKKMKLPLD